MITKEYLEQINPDKIPYNPKYSWGTYSFLKKYKNKVLKYQQNITLIIVLKED